MVTKTLTKTTYVIGFNILEGGLIKKNSLSFGNLNSGLANDIVFNFANKYANLLIDHSNFKLESVDRYEIYES